VDVSKDGFSPIAIDAIGTSDSRWTPKRYFDPFTGRLVASKFADALTAGTEIRKDWMRRPSMRHADASLRQPATSDSN
jgi:hypothetical protein